MDTNETPLEDQRQQALKHYEEASNAIMHWSSFVRDAIMAYDPKQNSHKHGVMQGLPIEFVEWLGEHYIKMHGGWIPKYSNQIKPNLKTTMEIYEAYHALKDILNCPTIAHTGSPSVGKAGEDASVSDGM